MHKKIKIQYLIFQEINIYPLNFIINKRKMRQGAQSKRHEIQVNKTSPIFYFYWPGLLYISWDVMLSNRSKTLCCSRYSWASTCLLFSPLSDMVLIDVVVLLWSTATAEVDGSITNVFTYGQFQYGCPHAILPVAGACQNLTCTFNWKCLILHFACFQVLLKK